MTSFAIIDAQGECLAITESRDEVLSLLPAAHEYFADAAACGHPAAPGWVAKRFPLTVHLVRPDERAMLLEEGTPTLQREP